MFAVRRLAARSVRNISSLAKDRDAYNHSMCFFESSFVEEIFDHFLSCFLDHNFTHMKFGGDKAIFFTIVGVLAYGMGNFCVGAYEIITNTGKQPIA